MHGNRPHVRWDVGSIPLLAATDSDIAVAIDVPACTHHSTTLDFLARGNGEPNCMPYFRAKMRQFNYGSTGDVLQGVDCVCGGCAQGGQRRGLNPVPGTAQLWLRFRLRLRLRLWLRFWRCLEPFLAATDSDIAVAVDVPVCI